MRGHRSPRHLVDYWDLNIGTLNWGEDAGSSRFFETNHEAPYTQDRKERLDKPVVNVGRFTDPDVMVEAIPPASATSSARARPRSPIRSCREDRGGPARRHPRVHRLQRLHLALGAATPICCTQNPTSGEEYRRGWHPERFTPAANADNDVLIVGAGPGGDGVRAYPRRAWDAPRASGGRRQEMGGHLQLAHALPGLGKWGRVTNYRQTQLDKLKNVEFVPGTRLRPTTSSSTAPSTSWSRPAPMGSATA